MSHIALPSLVFVIKTAPVNVPSTVAYCRNQKWRLFRWKCCKRWWDKVPSVERTGSLRVEFQVGITED